MEASTSGPAGAATPREPFLGLFGWLVAAALALLALARLLALLADIGDMPGEDVAHNLFHVLGIILAGIGLGAAGLFGRGMAPGIRTALVIGGAYFLVFPTRLAIFGLLD
jgi:hypothetical protein